MLQNYLKIAIRNIRRSVSYTFINVSGLALGISCSLVIFSIVSYHLSFDTFHKDAERIYRFVTEGHRDRIDYDASVPPAFGKQFRDDYTYGEKVARLFSSESELISIEKGSRVSKFKEAIAFADPEFFEIFNFPILTATRGPLLSEPNTAIITERIARKWFGNDSPVDKTFRLNNSIDFKIVGVLDAIPDNTDLHNEIFFSYSTLKQYDEWAAADDSWGGITSSIQAFTRLRPGVTPEEVETVLPNYVKKYRPNSKNVHHYKLQPLAEMHFDPRYHGKMSKTTIWVLAVIGFFLIVTACLNFINLATAQAINRSKEVGVRKALGSKRGQLFWQFTSETGLIVILSSVLAYGVSTVVLPFINELFETRVSLNVFSDIRLLIFITLLGVVVTLLAGSYPGLVLSGFKPVNALRGKATSYAKGSLNLRRVLITAQFVISQILLIGVIVVVYQMDYFKNVDMGFDQDAIVMIPLGSTDTKMTTVRNQFERLPNVENVSVCFSAPASDMQWSTSLSFDNRTETENFAVHFRGGDENYLSTFGIELIAGRNLTPSDTAREFVVNETLLTKLGIDDPDDILGRNLAINGKSMSGPIVGVVRDFHDGSLRSVINPIAIATSKEHYNMYAVKINMAHASDALNALKQTWSDMYPEQIYEYSFLNEQTAAFYKSEQTMLILIQVFAGIALFIGCMGLYGLVSFMAVQKTKEIGIRKVLGGTIGDILWIFGKEFSRLIVFAFIVSAPIAWLLMSKWLENYEYKVNLSAWIFALEIAIISMIVLLTVGFKSLKAAVVNPANSLRAE